MPQKCAIVVGDRTISVEVLESVDEVRLSIECSVAGPIPDSRQYDNLLEETVAAFEGDLRRIVMCYEGRAAVLRKQSNGVYLRAFGKLKEGPDV